MFSLGRLLVWLQYSFQRLEKPTPCTVNYLQYSLFKSFLVNFISFQNKKLDYWILLLLKMHQEKHTKPLRQWLKSDISVFFVIYTYYIFHNTHHIHFAALCFVVLSEYVLHQVNAFRCQFSCTEIYNPNLSILFLGSQ